MAALEPDIAALSKTRIQAALEAGDTFDFMPPVGNAIPISVVSWLIGFEESDPQALLKAALDTTQMLAGTMSLPELEAMFQRTSAVGAWIAGQLQGALASERDGILGAIARSIQDEVLRFEEGLIVIHTLLSAGGESTSSLLGNAVRLLAEHPDFQQSLREAPSLIVPFIEEALRLESPFRFHMRAARRTTKLAGVEIPDGATLLLLWAAGNRDPREFPDPDELKLDRPNPHHHLAFGRGMHFCVGAPLARLEARTVITTLLEETEHFALAERPAPRRANSAMMRRHESLPLACRPRRSVSLQGTHRS
jgi:cytochrome P450